MSDEVETRVLNEGSEDNKAAKSDPAYVILCREIDQVGVGVGVALHDYGPCLQRHLKHLAKIAIGEGFDLMFEFNEPPDMSVVQSRAMVGQVSGMDSMVQLWVLNAEKAGV